MDVLAARLPKTASSAPAPASIAAAEEAGLRWIGDGAPGLRRVRRRRGFRYLRPDGSEVRDPETLDRIAALGIPPAWEDVWICPDARGHIQATGRDARGRKQYRYHARWHAVRDATKFDRMIGFAEALPRIRARVDRDMRRPSLSRERVLATVVRLLDTTLIRVGNAEYARDHGHYGLTTIRNHHVRVRGDLLVFRFRGKSGKERHVSVRDARAARVVRRCQELPGQELFEYVTRDGTIRDVRSEDVNAYLREASGGDFTAKDFRTWAATVLAGLAIREVCAREQPPRGTQRQIVAAVKAVAETLGNTPAVCRRAYVHPWVIRAHEEGTLLSAIERLPRARDRLRPEEAATLAFLRACSRASEATRPARGVRAAVRSARHPHVDRRLRRSAA